MKCQKQKYDCEFCNYNTTSIAHLEEHFRIHTGEKPFCCELCDYKSAAKSNLARHTKIYHESNNELFESRLDSITNSYPEEVSFEVKSASESSEEITLVDFSLQESNIIAHSRNKFDERGSFIGTVKGKCKPQLDTFSKAEGDRELVNTTNEERQITSKSTKPWKCQICKKSFANAGNKKRHMIIHAGKKPYTCEICGKRFNDLSNKKRHEMIHSAVMPRKLGPIRKILKPASSKKRRIIRQHANKNIVSRSNKSLPLRNESEKNQCNICGKRFANPGNKKRHMMIHSGKKPFKCEICCRAFTDISNMRTHHKRHKHVACSVKTNQSAGVKYDKIKKHKITHSGKKPYVCGSCGKKFADASNCTKHTNICHFQRDSDTKFDFSKTTMKNTLSSFDKTVFTNGNSSTKSSAFKVKYRKECPDNVAKRKHNFLFMKNRICQIRGKASTISSPTKNYCVLHTGMKPYACEICGKAVADSSAKKKHCFLHTGMKPYVCEICGKAFADPSAKKRHCILHTGMKPYVCEICGKDFADPSAKRKHCFLHTGMKSYESQICEKGFTFPSSRGHHFLVRTGMKSKSRKTHKKKLSNSSTKITHSVARISMKPSKCENFGKAFTGLPAKKRHLLVYSDLKPYVCEICGKEFSNQSSMKTHYIVHTGVKPYKCEICGKTFASSSYMKIHLMIHSGQKPYLCEICGRGFTDPSSRKRHQKIHTKFEKNIDVVHSNGSVKAVLHQKDIMKVIRSKRLTVIIEPLPAQYAVCN